MGNSRDVLVLHEPARVARAHPPLREDTNGHRGVDRGVDTDGEVARVLQDDGGAEVLEASLGPDVPLERRNDERMAYMHGSNGDLQQP